MGLSNIYKSLFDGKRLKKLSADEKNAVIRIWLEVIEADGMTSSRELESLPEITPVQFASSRALTFNQAIEAAKVMNGDTRNMILRLSKEIALSDRDLAAAEQRVLDQIVKNIPDC
ncbi:MAG: hypothetical protein CL958_00105 [Euryarchaeota archaeon]|nr:hypothetical protein [Marinobacter sp.]|tara:strand:+ start:135 stop:482 length:348 start_codon:yes stop_codon:yes gene_type:complete